MTISEIGAAILAEIDVLSKTYSDVVAGRFSTVLGDLGDLFKYAGELFKAPEPVTATAEPSPCCDWCQAAEAKLAVLQQQVADDAGRPKAAGDAPADMSPADIIGIIQVVFGLIAAWRAKRQKA